ncbi:hypothetical protein ACWA2B_00905 [Paenibacillus sp. CMM36]
MSERTINLPDGLEPMSEEDLRTIWNKADDARGDQAYLSGDVFDLVNALDAAYAQIDSLQQQMAERDRTIALLTEEQKPKKWEVVNTVYFNDDSNQIYGYKVKNEDNTMRRIISSKTANELTLKGKLIFSPRQELSFVSVDRDYIEKELSE